MAHGQSKAFTSAGRWIGRHAWWVVGFWVVVAAALNIVVPQLELTVARTSADFLPGDLAANQHLEAMARDFKVPPSNGVSSIVLVNERGISTGDEQYYQNLLSRLMADKENIAYVIDIYGNPLSRDIARSPDGKAVTLMIAAQGSVGSTRAHHSTGAIRDIINDIPKPAGLVVHYSGPTATLADLFSAMDFSLLIITLVSIALITALLFVAYRRFATAAIPLIIIGITLGIARPIISILGGNGALSVSNFTIAIMTALVLGAGTDYAIFTIASYHEARRNQIPVADAVAVASGRTAPILVASALTIAAACTAMIFTKIGMFTTAGPPTAIAILVAAAVALTLPPALLSLAGQRGLAEPRGDSTRIWQRRGVRVIRHAGVYTAVVVIFLVGTASILATFRMNWDESSMFLHANDSTRGYDAVYKHFGVNDIAPEYVIVRSDHDLRNTTDLAALELSAIALSNVPEVAKVTSITRPDGKPLPEAASGYQTGIVGDQLGNAAHQMVTASPELRRLASGVTQLSAGADDAVSQMPALVSGTDQVVTMAGTVLDGLATAQNIVSIASDGSTNNVADTLPILRTTLSTITSLVAGFQQADATTSTALRQLNSTFGPLITARPTARCQADPTCLVARAAFGQLDLALGGRASQTLRSIQGLAGVPADLVRKSNALLPQLRSALNTVENLTRQLNGRSPEQVRSDLARLTDGVAQLSDGMTQLATGLRQVKEGTDRTVKLTGQLTAGLNRASSYLTTMSAKTTTGPGTGFYLPPEALHDKRFVAGSQLLLAPDGKTARMLVTWKVNPYGEQALDISGQLPGIAHRALADTGLADAQVQSTGLASLSAGMQDQVISDFIIFATVAVLAVLLILIVLLRSILAPILLVGTVILSFAATIGISTLVWQHGFGIPLDWSVIPVSFMALIAVGADYSMLFASRIREEAASDGMVRGVIRGFGSTGGVITTAGVVFALTMFALMSGTVLNLVQIGFTIGVGLLLDIALVRSVLVPAAMVVLGDRIWWPAHPRPTSPIAD
ncbi:MMPL family transporter [Gordonia sp. CPCC 205333]|uniref:MMPL family transporter n=1 Tax=Gordonia sp. CPCC 205333 TaxID=3140790 RepID=UPI003AF37F63